jgi:WXG100 family type VII secretion target
MPMVFTHKTIRVDPDLLLEKADQIEDYSDDFGNIYDYVCNLFDTMNKSGMWEGLAFDEMQRVTALNTKRFESVSDRLQDMADYLRRVAETMSVADEDAASKIKISANKG